MGMGVRWRRVGGVEGEEGEKERVLFCYVLFPALSRVGRSTTRVLVCCDGVLGFIALYSSYCDTPKTIFFLHCKLD